MSRKIKSFVLTSHCLLNPYSRVHILTKNFPMSEQLNYYLLKNKVGIIQLPCPEFAIMGYLRNPQGKQQYNNHLFRNHCEELLKPFLLMIQDYIENNFIFVGFIGVQGSPTCSVYWGKHKKNRYNTESINPIENVRQYTNYTYGVFTEIIKNKLSDLDIDVPFLEAPIKSKVDSLEAKRFWLKLTKAIEINEKYKNYIPI